MDRRTFISAVAGGLVAAPLMPWAQPPKVWRIGYLIPTHRAAAGTTLLAR